MKLALFILVAQFLSAQTFDYSVTLTGGRVLVQGGGLPIVIANALVSGTPAAGDNGLDIAVSGMPTGMSFSFPDIDNGGCCGSAPNYWIYGIGAGIAGGYLKLQTTASTLAGTYNLTVTTTSHLEKLVHTWPLTITVLSTAQISLAVQPFPAATPVPSKAAWEANMTSNGTRLCDQTAIQTQGMYDGSVWYYDGERVFYQIGDYTKDPKWGATCALWVDAAYKAGFSLTTGIQGYRVFTQGFRTNFQRTGDVTSKAAVLNLAKLDGWWENPGHVTYTDSIREAAYALMAELDDEAVNGTSYPQDKALMEALLGILDQMFITKNYTWYQPFMVGLACEALIKYYNEKTPDVRIPWYVKQALDGLWNQAWNETGHQFEYRCYQDGCYTPDDDSTYPPTGNKTYPTGMANLNLLIAPAFAWIYSKTGDPVYRDRGDLVFTDGVQFGDIFRGKEFSQNYRWSFDYIKYREQVATPPPPPPPVITSKVVHGEVPVKAAIGWDLAHIPLNGVSCYSNGLRQSTVDTKKPNGTVTKAQFSQIGTKLQSSAWSIGNVIMCDYEY